MVSIDEAILGPGALYIIDKCKIRLVIAGFKMKCVFWGKI
jgi:hypothetical protein